MSALQRQRSSQDAVVRDGGGEPRKDRRRVRFKVFRPNGHRASEGHSVCERALVPQSSQTASNGLRLRAGILGSALVLQLVELTENGREQMDDTGVAAHGRGVGRKVGVVHERVGVRHDPNDAWTYRRQVEQVAEHNEHRARAILRRSDRRRDTVVVGAAFEPCPNERVGSRDPILHVGRRVGEEQREPLMPRGVLTEQAHPVLGDLRAGGAPSVRGESDERRGTVGRVEVDVQNRGVVKDAEELLSNAVQIGAEPLDVRHGSIRLLPRQHGSSRRLLRADVHSTTCRLGATLPAAASTDWGDLTRVRFTRPSRADERDRPTLLQRTSCHPCAS